MLPYAELSIHKYIYVYSTVPWLHGIQYATFCLCLFRIQLNSAKRKQIKGHRKRHTCPWTQNSPVSHIKFSELTQKQLHTEMIFDIKSHAWRTEWKQFKEHYLYTLRQLSVAMKRRLQNQSGCVPSLENIVPLRCPCFPGEHIKENIIFLQDAVYKRGGTWTNEI